ncbi:MAG TPA: FHA domain-containing protein, partial [Pyrinomonadaceae bacterium]|nr:FHA domain-containing protein [Pyrinomonadaceae bacterium]
VESGEVLVFPHWENGNSAPEIRFNLNPSKYSVKTSETLPRLFETDFEYSDSDEITLIRPIIKTLFKIEIWHNQIYERILPVNQPQISLGRGLPADIQLADPEISRRHAILWQEAEGIFNIMVTGGSPVFIRETAVPQGQTAAFLFGDTVTLGSYDLKLLNA